MRTRTVVVLAYDRPQVLDVTELAEVCAVVLARRVARYFVVFMQSRRAGAVQRPAAHRAGRATELRDLLDAITENPAGDHRLAMLSERAGSASAP